MPVAHRAIECDHGNDAFLVEPESVGPPLARFLAEGVDRRNRRESSEECADS